FNKTYFLIDKKYKIVSENVNFLINDQIIFSEQETLFKDNETDPKSEALPAIWSNYADFTAKSYAMTSAAANALASFASQDDLVPAMQAMGGSCKGCHSAYRK
ncbi:MAG: cytochrome c, partial [Paracoccaceae bacterium]